MAQVQAVSSFYNVGLLPGGLAAAHHRDLQYGQAQCSCSPVVCHLYLHLGWEVVSFPDSQHLCLPPAHHYHLCPRVCKGEHLPDLGVAWSWQPSHGVRVLVNGDSHADFWMGSHLTWKPGPSPPVPGVMAYPLHPVTGLGHLEEAALDCGGQQGGVALCGCNLATTLLLQHRVPGALHLCDLALRLPAECHQVPLGLASPAGHLLGPAGGVTCLVSS